MSEGKIDRYTAYRMDHRTEAEFKTDMFQFTHKEKLYGEIFALELSSLGHSCTVTDHGVDNTGEMIRGKLANCNPDKMYSFPGGSRMYVEIKTVPEKHSRFHTFKLSAVKGCYNYGALILVPKVGHYFIYGSKSMERMMERCEVIHNFAPFGNKPCLQPSMSFIKQMISDGIVMHRVWTDEAKKLIESVKHTLLADRMANRLIRA